MPYATSLFSMAGLSGCLAVGDGDDLVDRKRRPIDDDDHLSAPFIAIWTRPPAY
jgi:hypothetical protein